MEEDRRRSVKRVVSQEDRNWESLKRNFALIKTNIQMLWAGVITDADRDFLRSCNIDPFA